LLKGKYEKTQLNKECCINVIMIKTIYKGYPRGLYKSKNWLKFLRQFEEVDNLRKRNGADYDYTVDHIVSYNIVALYTNYKSRNLQIRKNEGKRIKVELSAVSEKIGKFEKIIEKEMEKY
jgi:hypothetical protein